LDFALGAILSPKDDKGILHAIAFYFRKSQAVEIEYKIHDKERLAIVDSFKIWRHYLEEAHFRVMVHSDHQNLVYVTMTKVLNRRQACWA
jgi:hypothetical protein